MNQILKQRTFLDLFPPPEFLKLSITGVALTDYDTKFVQLRKKIFGDGFELAHATRVENPEGAIEAGVIKKASELLPILKRLASHYDVRYVNAVLPEEKSYLFTANINKVPKSQLRDAVAFIVEENAPVTLADSIFDFEIVGENVEASTLKVAVSVLPKNFVNEYIALFESAGITPTSLDVESQAIARTIIPADDNRAYLVINLFSKKTGFYIVEDGAVQFSTTSLYGYGANDDSYSDLTDLKAEMRKVIAFWNARANDEDLSDRKIEKAILCGIGAGRRDYVERLMEGSELDFELANVWLNTTSDKQKSEIPFEESLDYASAIGLVLPGRK